MSALSSKYALLHANGMSWDGVIETHRQDVMLLIAESLRLSATQLRKGARKDAMLSVAEMMELAAT